MAAGRGKGRGKEIGVVFLCMGVGVGEARSCIIYVSKSNVEGTVCVLHIFQIFKSPRPL